jgi:hypothetical protein
MPMREWGQRLSLLWFDDSLRRSAIGSRDADDDEEPLLEELDGILPWPGKSKRR